jgi:hypothetical protein
MPTQPPLQGVGPLSSVGTEIVVNGNLTFLRSTSRHPALSESMVSNLGMWIL